MTEAVAWALAEYRRRRRLGEWPRDALEAMMDAFALEPVFTDAERAVRQLFGQLLTAEARGHARRWRSRCVHVGVRWSWRPWPIGRCTGCGVMMRLLTWGGACGRWGWEPAPGVLRPLPSERTQELAGRRGIQWWLDAAVARGVYRPAVGALQARRDG